MTHTRASLRKMTYEQLREFCEKHGIDAGFFDEIAEDPYCPTCKRVAADYIFDTVTKPGSALAQGGDKT